MTQPLSVSARRPSAVLAAIVAAFAMVLVSLVANPLSASASVQATYYASPTGSGSSCTSGSPCSLTGARDLVRTVNSGMSGDIVIQLADGDYGLTSPFELQESASIHDSGTNGHNIIYTAASGAHPVIDGGVSVTGWSSYGSAGIYRAYVGAGFDTKQVYVNGVRATLARQVTTPADFTISTSSSTPTITTTNSAFTGISSWRNPSRIGLAGSDNWKMYECPIASASSGTLTMQDPCITNAVTQDATQYSWHTVNFIENAFELLDQPGEWYYDYTDGYMYYMPRTGENLSTASVVAAHQESLVNAHGSAGHPLHNVVLDGLSFQHATWMQPIESQGMSSRQANEIFRTDSSVISLMNIPAAVTFDHSYNISVTNNIFTRLGGTGLMFTDGAQNSLIKGNAFYDISAGGIHIGDVSNEAATDTSVDGVRAIGNEISDNYLTNTGVEYLQTVAIFGGYNDSLTVTHNEISNLPYTAISLGWGWGSSLFQTTTPWAQNNVVSYNRIFNILNSTSDGGPIYFLGHQPGSEMSHNYVSDNGVAYSQGLYMDNGTTSSTAHDNVVSNTGQHSFLINADSWSPATNNSMYDNYADGDSFIYGATNGNSITYTAVTGGAWPSGAIAIQNAAGLESGYTGLRGLGTVATVAATSQIEAESYKAINAATNYGTVIGALGSGSYLKYTGIDFGSGTLNSAQLRVAASPGGHDLQIRIGGVAGTLIGTLTVADTGSYGTFTTQSTAISSVSGVHDVYVVGYGGAGIANFDWFTFSTSGGSTGGGGVSATSHIEAESYTALSGATDYGTIIGSFDNGDWLEYHDVNFGTSGSVDTADLSVGTGTPGQDIQIRLGSPSGTLIGTLTVSGTGGYGTYTTQSTGISSVSGLQDVYLVGSGSGGIANIDWFTFSLSGGGSGPTPVSATSQIEAETYVATSGTSNLTTSIGSFDSGDWLEYDIDFGSSGSVDTADLHVATGAGGHDIQIRLGSPSGTLIGTLTVAGTGGYSTFTTQSTGISAVSGVQDVYLVGSGGSAIADIDWFTFSVSTPPSGGGTSATSQIEAESYAALSGATDYGSIIGGFDNGDWLEYANIDFGTSGSVDTADLHVGTGTPGQDIQVRLGSPSGTLIGTLTVAGTGGYGTYTTQSTSITSVSGLHDVYLVGSGSGGIANIDWFTFHLASGGGGGGGGTSATSQIEAETYTALSGATDYGTIIGGFDNGDWLEYDNVNFGSSATLTTAHLNVGTDPTSAGQDIQIRLGSPSGTLLGTLTVASTGWYGTYVAQTTSIGSVSGLHDVYLVGVGSAGIANIDWFTFS